MTDEQEDEKGCNLPQTRITDNCICFVLLFCISITRVLYFASICILHCMCIVFAMQEDGKGSILRRIITDKQTIELASLLTSNTFILTISLTIAA